MRTDLKALIDSMNEAKEELDGLTVKPTDEELDDIDEIRILGMRLHDLAEATIDEFEEKDEVTRPDPR